MICLASYHLWRSIARGAAGSAQGLTLFVSVAQAEVNQFDVAILVQQEILRLHVSMNNAELMEVLDG